MLEWLQSLPGNSNRAFCTFCKDDLSAHKKTLEDHCAKNKKHILIAAKKLNSIKNHKITSFILPSISDRRKIAELKISFFIARHCATAAVDALGELITSLDAGSETLGQIKLHRTKCTGKDVYS